MTRRLRTFFSLFFYGLMVAYMLYMAQEAAQYASGGSVLLRERKTIVLDVGHGGEDPGKVGEGEVFEKDINLAIARYLRTYLEQDDFEVVMTREEDVSLGTTAKGFDKSEDMKKRWETIEAAGALLAVSIHQNSFTDPSVEGAQVFYHEGSEEGKKLAEGIQKSLWERLDAEKKRESKADSTYYLFKKCSIPIVIVECGFLSNGEELEWLQQEWYQKRLAWAIYMGIVTAISGKA